MSLIWVPKRRFTQAASAVDADWSRTYPIAVVVPGAGMVRTFARGGLFERSAIITGSIIRAIAGKAGVGIGASTATTQTVQLHSVGNQTNTVWEKPSAAVSVLVFFERLGNAAGNAPIFGHGSATTSPYQAWAFDDLSGTGTLRFSMNGGGTLKTLNSGVMSNGVPIVAIGTYDGTNVNLYTAGTLDATTTASGSIVYPSSSERGPFLGNFYNYTGASRSFNGMVYLAAVWDRALSADEVRRLSANPWQLLSTAKQPIYTGAAASGLPTLSAPQMTGITTTGGYPQVAYTY